MKHRPAEKTLEEHVEFVREMAKLQLCFLWNWLKGHREEDFCHALRKRTDIYRKTDIYKCQPLREIKFDDQRWLELEKQVRAIYQQTRNNPDASVFECEGFRVFQKSLDARSERGFYRGHQLPGYQCGSLQYTPSKRNIPGLVDFHITNAVSPDGIFDDTRYLPRCLLSLMDKSEIEYGAYRLGVATWLNSHPKWLKIFPSEWLENMQPKMKNVEACMGWWGQFVNARGVLNQEHAGVLRVTGEFPFYPRQSWCSFNSIRRHLSEYLRRTD